MKPIYILAVAVVLAGCRAPMIEGYSRSEIKPDVDNRSAWSIEDKLYELERVPDKIQSIGNRFGNIVISDGQITKNTELEYLIGKRNEEDRPYNLMRGLYKIDTNTVFLRNVPSHIVTLHEYGHLINHALGTLSDSDEFMEIYNKRRNVGWFFNKLTDHEMLNSREFFATKFSEYYYSDLTREMLSERFPEVVEYFKNLENRLGI